MQDKVLPVLDVQHIQEKANEYATKGATDAIKEFYTAYDSPYKKAITENLKNKGLDNSFNIPDIIGVLNEKFSQEIDQIANAAVAKSFVPMLKEFLTREDAEVKFSDILKKFIDVTNFEYNSDLEIGDYSATKVRDNNGLSSFFSYQISNGTTGYELRFYKNREDLTTVMSLPYRMSEDGRFNSRYDQRTMKISLDGGATLEMPFTRGVLEDQFVSFVARLVIGNNNIIFDVDDFDEDLFPNNHCYCD